MSIIQEALKKAEELRGGRSGHKNDFVVAVKEPANEKSGSSAKEAKKTLLSIVLLSSFIIFVVSISVLSGRPVSKPLGMPQEKEMPLKAEAYSQAPYVAPLSVQKDTKINIKQPKLVLNGIMYLEETPKAIINNVMVEEGDIVEGALVRRIEENGVTLESKDSAITLKLK